MIAQAPQTFDEAPSDVFRLQSSEKVSPGVAVRLPAWDHGVGHNQNRVGHGENCALLSAPRRETSVLRTEIGAFGARRGVGGLHYENRTRGKATSPGGISQ